MRYTVAKKRKSSAPIQSKLKVIKKCKVVVSMLSSGASDEDEDDKVLGKSLPAKTTSVQRKSFGSKKKLVQSAHDSSSDDSDNETHHKIENHGNLSSYERTRLENISKNQDMLKKLELGQLFSIANQTSTRTKRSRPTKPYIRKDWSTGSRRRSERQLNMPAKSLEETKSEVLTYAAEHREELEERIPACLPLKDTIQTENFPLEDKCLQWSSLTKMKSEVSPITVLSSDSMSSLRERFRPLQLKENDVSKVLPVRVSTLAIHPSEEKILVAAGDKRGTMGIWDVDSTDNDVCLFKAFKTLISHIMFLPSDNTKILASSYDGSIRCCDINNLSFNEIYSAAESSYFQPIYGFSLPCDSSNTFLATEYNGNILVLDNRDSSCSTYNIDQRPLKYVDCHPTSTHLFVTCSNSIVSTWDSRNIKGSESALSTITLPKIANSAPFSPLRGDKIAVASMNDEINIYDINQSGSMIQKPSLTISHNNWTGRWLTKFRCMWDPRGSGSFVIGSMAKPRQVDIYYGYGDGGLIRHLRSENFASVASVNVFHPTLEHLIVGANSSGKMFVWR